MQPGNPVVGGTVLRRPAIQSPNFAAGSLGWAIFIDGTAEFNSVTIRNAVVININAPKPTTVIAIRSNVDTNDTLDISNDGSIRFGSGSAATDVSISRNAAGQLLISPNALVDHVLTIGGQGFTGQVVIVESGATDVGLVVEQTGDTNPRWDVLGSGKLEWGPGNAAVDVNLYRHASGVLRTDTAMAVGQMLINKTSAVALMSTTTALATDQAWSNKVGVESGNRIIVLGSGEIDWSDGTNPSDTKLGRTAAAVLGVTSADLAVATVGKGLQVKEGTNAKMGTAALTGGTVVVNTTAVTNNSRVFLTAQNTGGTPGALRVSARTAGTSFTITSSSGADTSTVAWMIVEPA